MLETLYSLVLFQCKYPNVHNHDPRDLSAQISDDPFLLMCMPDLSDECSPYD